jgi:hypothetical protein
MGLAGIAAKGSMHIAEVDDNRLGAGCRRSCKPGLEFLLEIETHLSTTT